MEIPFEKLNPATLRGVIEDFILREGTDYGQQEYSLDEKVEQVMKQLRKGDYMISFDPESETPSIVRKR